MSQNPLQVCALAVNTFSNKVNLIPEACGDYYGKNEKMENLSLSFQIPKPNVNVDNLLGERCRSSLKVIGNACL